MYQTLNCHAFNIKRNFLAYFLYCVHFLLYFVSEWVLHVSRIFFPLLYSSLISLSLRLPYEIAVFLSLVTS
jgi:hypothetical protein